MAISQEMRNAVRLWESAYILILDPGANNINFKNRSADAFAWHGFARVQPYRREIGIARPTDPTTTQSVRFQIDFSKDGAIPLIKTDFQVLVMKPEQIAEALLPNPDLLPAEDLLPGLFARYPELQYTDPHLTEYVHVVQSGMNSSLAWIRTLETTTDIQRRNTFTIESDGAGGFQWTPTP